ncbi:unnamed protein product [Diamesa hyperborea]
MSGRTSIKIFSNTFNILKPNTGIVRLFSAIVKCPETVTPKEPSKCPEPAPPTRSKKCPKPAKKVECPEPPPALKPRECPEPTPTPKRPKPKASGSQTACRQPRPKNVVKCPKTDDDSKCKSKYSTGIKSENAVKVPAASRWRNVRGCVKPEIKQKPLQFTQNSPPPFDLLKSKQQLQITC